MFIVFGVLPRCNRLPVVACNISKGSLRPSTIIDDSNALAPVLRIEQNVPFIVAATSRRTVIVILRATASGRLCPRRVSYQQRHFDNSTPARRSNLARRSMLLNCLVDLVAFHNGRAYRVGIVVHTSEDDGTSGGGSEFASRPIFANYIAVFVLVGALC